MRSFSHSTWSGPGLFKMQGGLTDFTFGPGFHVEVTNITSTGFYGACTNQGVVRWLGSGQLWPGTGCTFYNEGQFLVESNCSLSSGGGPNGNFINTGIIQTPANGGVSTFTIEYWNFTNRGTIKAETNSVLEVRPSNYSIQVAFEKGTVFDGPGVIRFPYGERFTWDGAMTLNTTLEFEGLGVYGNSVWSGPGLFVWKGGGMTGFTFGPDFHVEITTSAYRYIGGSCTNWGSVRWLGNGGTLSFDGGCTFNNYGDFTVETNGTLQAVSSPPGVFNNSGALELENGNLTINCLFSASPFSVLKVLIGGTALGTGFGHETFVDIGPTLPVPASFAGTLNVALTNGFVPVAGNSFTIADYLSYTGTFSSNSLPALPPGLQWQVNYGPTALTLSVVASSMSVTNAMRLPDGNFAFQVVGTAGGSAVIQAATNLNSPIVWTNLATNTPFTGVHNFTDTQATNFPGRFYRVLIGP